MWNNSDEVHPEKEIKHERSVSDHVVKGAVTISRWKWRAHLEAHTIHGSSGVVSSSIYVRVWVNHSVESETARGNEPRDVLRVSVKFAVSNRGCLGACQKVGDWISKMCSGKWACERCNFRGRLQRLITIAKSGGSMYSRICTEGWVVIQSWLRVLSTSG